MSQTNGSATALKERVATLEKTVAEQGQQLKRLATALASFLATQMQPQLQQQLADQLLGTEAAAPVAMPTNGQEIHNPAIEKVLNG